MFNPIKELQVDKGATLIMVSQSSFGTYGWFTSTLVVMKQNLRTKFFYGPFTKVYDIISEQCGYKKSIRDFLKTCGLINNNQRILDAGCGTGTTTIALAELWPDSRIIAFDYSETMLNQARKTAQKKSLKNISFYQGNIESINPLRDKNGLVKIIDKESFDLVIVSGVLEHVNLKKTVQELARFLKNGYLINIGAKNNLYGKVLSKIMGFETYTRRELEEAFKQANLGEIEEIPFSKDKTNLSLSKIVLIGRK